MRPTVLVLLLLLLLLLLILPLLLPLLLLLLQYYHYDVRAAHEAAHGLSPAETRACPCETFAERSRRAVYCCDQGFSWADGPGRAGPM